MFYLAGFIESWGRGIEKICNTLRAENLPLPEYTIHLSDIMIKFSAPKDMVLRSDKVTDRVTDKELELLQLLSEYPNYTMLQLSEKAGISRKTIALRLKHLKEQGLIERIGSDRKGYWQINSNARI